MASNKKIDPLSIRILVEIAVVLAVVILLLIAIGNVWAGIGQADGDEVETTPPEQPNISSPGWPSIQAPTTPATEPPDTSPQAVLETFIADNGLSMTDYPAFVLENYNTCAEFFGPNFESQSFLLNYPFMRGITQEVDISDVDRSNGVPLFIQWDDRWGYMEYGISIVGIGGCGPTSLSMVAYYLTGDPKYTPTFMVNYAIEKQHVIPTGGTDWSLFGTGAVELGFKVEELPNVERTVVKRLEKGIPVVVNVGPGTFTTGGHYMVLVGYEDGMFRINDPNSREFSSRLWAWDEFSDQVKNFWAISNP